MLNKRMATVIVVIALALGIALLFPACNKNKSAAGKESYNGSINKIRLSNVPVTVTGASSSYDFGYTSTGPGEISPLSDFFTGTPKAIVKNGRLTLELDAPKSDLYLFQPLINTYRDISATPGDAKGYKPSFDTSNVFDESTNSYSLSIKGPDQGKDVNGAYLLYVDKDVTVNGGSFDNIFLTKGWNYVTYTYSNGTNYVKTASQTLPTGYVWTVKENGIFKAPRDDVVEQPDLFYYATSNLRLRSEPDTSKDNIIARVPQGSKVEMFELGYSETIDNINARWFKVKTADGTVGWLFSGYLSDKAPK